MLYAGREGEILCKLEVPECLDCGLLTQVVIRWATTDQNSAELCSA